VDPGNLDDDDVELDNVNHLRIKIQDAIPLLKKLLKKEQSKINVFVSDACLHEMEGQLEFLLLAKESRILDDNSFFVLTLKCTTWYSKAHFEVKLFESGCSVGKEVERGESVTSRVGSCLRLRRASNQRIPGIKYSFFVERTQLTLSAHAIGRI